MLIVRCLIVYETFFKCGKPSYISQDYPQPRNANTQAITCRKERYGLCTSVHTYLRWCWCVQCNGYMYPPIILSSMALVLFWFMVLSTLFFSCECARAFEALNCILFVATLLGDHVVLKDYKVEILGWSFCAELVIFDIVGFDVILSMDWLTQHYACLECNREKVVFKPLGRNKIFLCNIQRLFLNVGFDNVAFYVVMAKEFSVILSRCSQSESNSLVASDPLMCRKSKV